MQKLYFDIESTSADASTAKIIQLGICVLDEEGNIILEKSKKYNPECEIDPKATETHGIKIEDLKDCPIFAQDARKLKKIFENKILIGFNILKFDVPILLREFEEAHVELDLSGEFIDVLKLETELNPRTLSAVYERYTGEKMKESHDALADVKGTRKVLGHQLKRIKELGLDKKEILEKCGSGDGVDFFGKLKLDEEGFLIFNFGKAKGVRVINDPNYAAWILNEKFPAQVKKLIREEQSKYLSNKKEETKPRKQGFYPVRVPDNYPIKKDGKLF